MINYPKLQRELAVELFGPDVGCIASVCVFGRSSGMNTQGPCHCPKDPQTAVKLSRMVRVLLERRQKLLDPYSVP